MLQTQDVPKHHEKNKLITICQKPQAAKRHKREEKL